MINVMLVLQSCTDPLHILPDLTSEKYATASDGTYNVGNMMFGEDLDIKEEEKLNVKAEKNIGSEKMECLGIKYEEGIHSEEEKEEEEDTGIGEEDVGIKEEVSFKDTV